MTFNKLYILLLTLIALSFLTCERDDICAEATGTTPNLIIVFYDINNPENTKSVPQLSVFGEGNEENLILTATDTDSITLPLNFDAEDVLTSTRFVLKKDTDLDTDEDEDGNPDETTVSNSDIIEVSYTPQFVYVSRACGYKSVFNGAQVSFDSDDDNWIINNEVLNETIENENTAHIIIYH